MMILGIIMFIMMWPMMWLLLLLMRMLVSEDAVAIAAADNDEAQ